MAKIPTLRVVAVHGHGGSNDGEVLVVQCDDQSGQTFDLAIHRNDEVEFFSHLLSASSRCAQKRGDAVTAFDPESIDIAGRPDGMIGLRLQFSSGLEMNMTLKDEHISRLRQMLDDLEAYRKAGGPPRAS